MKNPFAEFNTQEKYKVAQNIRNSIVLGVQDTREGVFFDRAIKDKDLVVSEPVCACAVGRTLFGNFSNPRTALKETKKFYSLSVSMLFGFPYLAEKLKVDINLLRAISDFYESGAEIETIISLLEE